MGKLKQYLFEPHFHFSRFQFNFVTIMLLSAGLAAGAFLTASKLISILAANDTVATWTFDTADVTAGHIVVPDTNLVAVDTSAHPGVNKLTNGDFETVDAATPSGLLAWNNIQNYQLDDEFSDAQQAGHVGSTNSITLIPGVGLSTRTVPDANSLVSVTGGQLSFSGGNTIYTDPGIRWAPITRSPGMIFFNTIRIASGQIRDGYTVSGAIGNPRAGFTIASGSVYAEDNPTELIVGTSANATTYQVATVLRTTGTYLFIKGGIYSNWTLLWVGSKDSTAALNPMILDYNSVFTADSAKIPTATWLPTPLAYDTFATPGTSATETTGPDSQSTSSLGWTGSTWTVSGGSVSNTPTTTGSELLTNGDMETPPGGAPTGWTGTNATPTGVADERTGGVGTQAINVALTADYGSASKSFTAVPGGWYVSTAWVKKVTTTPNVFFTGTGGVTGNANPTSTSWNNVVASGRAGVVATSVTLQGGTGVGNATRGDDFSVKQLSLPTLFRTVNTSSSNVIVDTNITRAGGTQAGIVLNLDSASSPSNFVIAYFDGNTNGNIRLDKSSVERITNASFETAGAGGADVFGSWNETAGDGTITSDTSSVHSGTHAMKLIGGATPADSPKASENLIVIPGNTYTFSFWTRGDGTNAGRYGVFDVTHGVDLIGATTTGISSTSYQLFTSTFTATAGTTSVNFVFRAPNTNGGYAYFDDASVLAQSPTDTTYTTLTSGTVTYTAGATLRVVKDGTSYSVYYNNAQVGTTQTITETGIVNNTIHGLFSTDANNSFDNFTIWPRGTGGEYTSIPADDLTVSQDTGTKYAGSASAKLVAGGNDANFLQPVTTSADTYNIVGYAYVDATTAIDAGTLSLYWDTGTSTVTSPTYTYLNNGGTGGVGGTGGWYKLSGTVTGSASQKNFGVRVKAGKTVYLDEVTIYKAGTYIVSTDSYSNAQVHSWDTFCEGTLSGSTCTTDATHTGSSAIKYQLSADSGVTWQYYTGGAWHTATDTSTTVNSPAELTTAAMQSFDVVAGVVQHKQVSVRVIFTYDGTSMPTLPHVAIGLTSDTNPPSQNASAILMSRSASGSQVASSPSGNQWTSNSAPYFSWTPGVDNEEPSGVRYCLYLGQEDAAGPNQASNLLNTDYPGGSPMGPAIYTTQACRFVISGTSIDFATTSYRGTARLVPSPGTWLTTSGSPYYFKVWAADPAGNVQLTNPASFTFYYDVGVPTNVAYISPASGNFSNVVDMNFAWPTSGSSASKDGSSESGLLGWQYQINSSTGSWQGTTHDADLGLDYIPATASAYILTQARDSKYIVSGNNVVYFRTVDKAGNASVDATVRTGNLSYGGAAPSFGGSDAITVTPSTSVDNSFALSWPAATATNGQSIAHYYYMVNTSPPSTLATLQGNSSTYIDNGTSLSVAAAALPGVNKGTNTVYVVAVDDATTPNYSPSNYISGTFTLNSTDPDNVGNLVASDSSIKSQSQWNVTLTWTAPVYQGAGNLTYLVKRSTDNSTFTQVGTSSGLSYVDNAPSSKQYYYKVFTKDGASAVSSGTNAVTIIPTGKWTSAPSLDSGPDSGSVTTKKATITWSTGRTSDSKVQFGTSTGSYNDVEPSNSSQVTAHSIQLTGLSPGTTYYYRAKWTDEDGNTGTSDEKTFTTDASPTVKDVTVGAIGLTNALLSYTVNGASKVKIYYGTTTSFGGLTEVSTSTSETTYTTQLSSLSDGTKYYYKLNLFDSEGSEYEGTILDFTTLPRPKITGVRLQQVTNTAQSTILVSWTTNTEVSSIVSYYPSNDPGAATDAVSVALTKGAHQMIVKGLLPQTDYILVVKGRDKVGNEAVSDSVRLTTATDTRPPVIADLHVEGSNIPPVGGTAQAQTAQLIVSWNTDEPATSQVEFGEGTGDTYSQKTQLDESLTINHLVVISGLTPSKVYHVRALSLDAAKNVGQSIDTVTITPKATENALNLVMTNLQQAFGFLQGVGK